MRALLQRVARAEVRVADTILGAIDKGLLVFLGVREGDTVHDVEYIASKVVTLRIFGDAQGKMYGFYRVVFHLKRRHAISIKGEANFFGDAQFFEKASQKSIVAAQSRAFACLVKSVS